MNKENCALKLVDEIILYYDARSKKTSNFIRSFPLISAMFCTCKHYHHKRRLEEVFCLLFFSSRFILHSCSFMYEAINYCARER